ncbi:TetR/AcrR family transcriptional regulator [Actinoplanes sp. NPDC049265]|uniref:TetR/AcrR family transcriptional regulator n=1 Tax=Actinoplanes sp. NPDC049265 TaxID=3363902 RepID=UPI00371C4BB5
MEAVSRPAGTRRRGAALEEVILEAAWAELNEAGYARTTVASVAARAQTGKQVLYRRWRNRARLAVAAVNHHVGPPISEPADTGSLRGDVLALLAAGARRVEAVDAGILQGILSELVDEDNVFAATMPRMVADLLDRAVARGELSYARVPARVLSLPMDLARQEFIRNLNRNLDHAFAEIIDQVFLPLVRSYSQAH